MRVEFISITKTMSEVTIYHNPRCSKSRQTMELLEERGITPKVVEYLQSPPDTETLALILERLGLSPRQLMRKKEEPYGTLGLDDQTLSDARLIQAMVDNPILIERPIVVANDRVAVGRPPENVLTILD